MKKTLFTIFAALFMFCAQSFGQVSVNGGYLNSTFTKKYGNTTTTTAGNGFYVGAEADLNIFRNGAILFSPGLYFDFVDYSSNGNKANNYLLRAPLHFKALYAIGRDADVFVSAGPSLIYGLGGQSTYNIWGGINYSDNFYGENSPRFDVTLGLEGGVALSDALKIVVGYDFGLLNQSESSDVTNTRNILHVGIGYIF